MLKTLLIAAAALGCSGEPATHQDSAAGASAAAAAADSELVAAAEAIAAGRPWRATMLLAPVLRDPARRTPTAVLLAASAAAGWHGWSEVTHLLTGETWLDSLQYGEGHALLARASLELRRDSAAVGFAGRAVATARDDEQRGRRLVFLARALDRTRSDDSARATYERAASALPSIADWLHLRAAIVDADTGRRAATLAAVRDTLPAGQRRIAEAQARERSGDRLGAAALQDSLGAPVEALRLRLLADTTPSSRDAIRPRLLALVSSGSGNATARAAIDLFDRQFTARTPAEELVIARRAASSGPAARAATGFAAAQRAGLLTPNDQFASGTVLFQLGRYRDAIAAFGRVTSGPLAGRAAYQSARARLRNGDATAAHAALARITTSFKTDTAAASSALYLLGDLATDDGRDSEARKQFVALAHRYPTSRMAPDARFRAALISLVSGSPRTAALEFDSLARRYPESSEALGAVYWAGRAWATVGDSTAARAHWRTVLAPRPVSWYGLLAARRLGVDAPIPPAAADSFATYPTLTLALARAALLDSLGFAPEAKLEYDQMVSDADESVERLLATAAAFRERGMAARSINLARRAQARGAADDQRLNRLIYPITQQEALRAEAKTNRLDPVLVAALIRQESSFEPSAVSPAGAIGLMQLMPNVGRQLAKGAGFPVWDVNLLEQPDVNIQLGTRHLAELMGGYTEVGHALAAYNAGQSRVTRWRTKKGVDDVEVFVERIPYVETRDYVRIIERNAALYRALYGADLATSPVSGAAQAR